MSSQTSLQFPAKTVVKANKMIRAKANLTKLEQKVLAALIAEVKKEDDRFRLIDIRVRDLIRKSNSKSEDFFSRGKEICKSLLDAKIEIQIQTEDGERSYSGRNLFSRCDYEEGKGVIKARFASDVEPFLLSLDGRFTMYLLQFILKLDRLHSIRVYELLKMREWTHMLDISVREFREILGLENKYDSFSHLRKFVIEPSREEIGEKTDIRFTYRVERDGRTPKRLKFFIHEKDVSEPIPSGGRKQRSLPDGEEECETDSPKLSVRDIFLSGLRQEEIANLTNIEDLEEQAVEQARKQNPDRSWSVVAYTAASIMERLWKQEGS